MLRFFKLRNCEICHGFPRSLLSLCAAVLLFSSCGEEPKKLTEKPANLGEVSLVILGTVQDAGSPQLACQKECCKKLFLSPDQNRKVVSLGLIDHEAKQTFLFEATPDITEQLRVLQNEASFVTEDVPNGIFLTHAHIGHYTGLMYLGKEAVNTDSLPVHVMPKMKKFLEQNGPWDQLTVNGNIELREMTDGQGVELSPNISVHPFKVPHRDEYSETVGYRIKGPKKEVLFIPDIDKWSTWEKNIVQVISEVDFAFLDATFYDGKEIDNRDISEIPHPFVVESMKLFKDLPETEKCKIHLIHFNHTNPLLDSASPQTAEVLANGFRVANINQLFDL